MVKRSLSLLLGLSLITLLCAASASALEGTSTWTIVATPGSFLPGEETGEYLIYATNTGPEATDGSAITVTDTLPAGVTLGSAKPSARISISHENFSCSTEATGEDTTVTCIGAYKTLVGGTIEMHIPVDVPVDAPAHVTNAVTVSGGGMASSGISTTASVSSTPIGFGVQSTSFSISNRNGSPATQAGSHPYEVTTSFVLNAHDVPGAFQTPVASAPPRDVVVNLPPGLNVNPTATPTRCTEQQFQEYHCPYSSAVGFATTYIGGNGVRNATVYNMVAPVNAPAQFAFDPSGFGNTVHIDPSIRTGEDYGISATVSDITEGFAFYASTVTLWGDPSEESHDHLRGHCLIAEGPTESSCPVERLNQPLISLPTSCGEPLKASVDVDSWLEPGVFASGSDTAPAITGCEKLDFAPTISVQPESSVANTPSGLDVDIHMPQEESESGLAETNLKEAVVALPAGVAVNPSSVDGLGACSEEEIGLHDDAEVTCPNNSKIGSVEVYSPLLDEPLRGGVYLAQQGNLVGNGSNPFGSLLAVYIAVDVHGVLVKLAGEVAPDPLTGQLTTTFANNPQLPFSDFKLDFFGGARGPLVMPATCGQYTTTSRLTGWNGAVATPSDTFQITSGCSKGFSPSFSAGTTNNQAGAFSPLSVTFSRSDTDQPLQGITVKTPVGLLGMLSSVTLCPEPQAAQGTCSAASLLGTATVGVGPGNDPFYTSGGQVFLTGPYKGAPFGLSIAVPAVAGPYDLGLVVVRAKIEVDPHTAALTITSDPFPTILQGVPLQVKTVNVTVNRPGFIFNPTSCEPQAISAAITSTEGATGLGSSRFQAANCGLLGFHPSFQVTTSAHTSKANGASLAVKLTYPNAPQGSQANIHMVKVSLPKQLPSRLTTLQKACTAATFEANPANCPPASLVGHATAVTPVLPVPLNGPVYFVSHGGEAFPSLIVVLQGYGVTVDLVGTTFISKAGITSSTFKQVPDVPISSFELVLPQGPFSALAANGNLCKTKLAMPTEFTAQSGAVLTQSTKIAVDGCPKTKQKTKTHKSNKRRHHRTKTNKNTKGKGKGKQR
jgi:uncharacterized repeat protein (TIGR01451 family)